MEIKAFAIEGFRSIKKTKWLPFSIDGITALVGQNESGKSSVLDALALGFSLEPSINRNDFRIDCGLPRISLLIELQDDDIEEMFAGFDDDASSTIRKYVKAKGRIEFVAYVAQEESGDFVRKLTVGADLQKVIEVGISKLAKALAGGIGEQGAPVAMATNAANTIGTATITKYLWKYIPAFTLFDEGACFLPDVIEVVNNKLERGAVGMAPRTF